MKVGESAGVKLVVVDGARWGKLTGLWWGWRVRTVRLEFAEFPLLGYRW